MPAGLDWLGWIVIGFLAGIIGGWFVPEHERMGCLGTTVIGVVGGLFGGWLWTEVLGQDRAGGFLGALLLASLGSAILLIFIRGLRRR